jgi:hypothetical protein
MAPVAPGNLKLPSHNVTIYKYLLINEAIQYYLLHQTESSMVVLPFSKMYFSLLEVEESMFKNYKKR